MASAETILIAKKGKRNNSSGSFKISFDSPYHIVCHAVKQSEENSLLNFFHQEHMKLVNGQVGDETRVADQKKDGGAAATEEKTTVVVGRKRRRVEDRKRQPSWLLIGANEIIKSLEKRQLCFVLVSAKFPRLLLQHLIVLAHRSEALILRLQLNGSAELGALLDLRSAAVIGVKNGEDGDAGETLSRIKSLLSEESLAAAKNEAEKLKWLTAAETQNDLDTIELIPAKEKRTKTDKREDKAEKKRRKKEERKKK